MTGCASSAREYDRPQPSDRHPFIARVDADGEMKGLEELNRVFSSANRGYSVGFTSDISKLMSENTERLAFIQSDGTMEANGASVSLQCGDIYQIHADESFRATSQPIAAILFQLPKPLDTDIPTLISPDNDPNITDSPGGCAEEGDAYRRICLTWLESRGKYIHHDLNAHRVRIRDSFTHFHPVLGGFDEFYLVQSSTPNAVLITSTHTERILTPDEVSRPEADELLVRTQLMAGDLIYLPRGVVHRGLGGAVIHVVAVPGFKPRAEIGVDHQIDAINRRTGSNLPLNRASRSEPKVK